MSLIKKTTASVALIAMTSGLFVNGASAYSTAQVEAANKLADAKIIVKQENAADYQLDRQVLRQEIAAVARGLAKVDKTTTCTNVFKDVSATKPNTWACYTVEALANAWLIAKNDKFRPEANITKAESIGMIVKAAYGNEYSYDSTKEGDWQKQVVDFAVSKGIVSSFSNYTTPATRGFVFEAAANTLTDGSNVLCEIFGTCPKEEPKKEEPKENNVVRGDNDLVVSLSPESPSNGMVVAGSDRAKLLAFDVTAGKEDVTLRKATVKFTGLGDAKKMENLSIYSNDVKLSRNSGRFNSSMEANISFDRDVVVKAGETKTLFVTATIEEEASNYNQTLRVSLTNLEASTTVKGAELTGATLTPYKVTNKAKIEVTSNQVNGRIKLGNEDTIYNLFFRETSRKEDVIVKSISFKEKSKNSGDKVDLDNLTDLSLYADNTKLDATFTYQKSKIVASLNHKVKADQRVNFVLKGKVIDDLTKTLSVELDEVYSIGWNSQVSIVAEKTWEPATYVTSKEVIWSSVNFTLNKNSIKEVSKKVSNVEVEELIFNSNANYLAEIEISVKSAENDNIEDLRLDWQQVDYKSWKYLFTDVNLNKGTTKLPLVVNTKENASGEINFNIKINSLEEEVTWKRIEDDKDLRKVFNSLTATKKVNFKDASITLSSVKLTPQTVIPKLDQQVILYKGNLNLEGWQDITLSNLKFKKNSKTTYNFTDLLSNVTLNIGGNTFNGDINNDTIDFSSIYAKIEKNSKNVQVLLTATLLNKNDYTWNDVIEVVAVNGFDSYSDIISKIVGTVKNNWVATVTLTWRNTLISSNITNELKNNVLAGTDNVEIGAFRFDSINSDIYFKELSIDSNIASTDTQKLSSALKNIRLVEGTKVIAEGGEVVENTATSKAAVKFIDFTMPKTSKKTTYKLVADLASVNTGSGQEVPFVWKISFAEITINTEDAKKSGDLKANEEEVSILPALVTFKVVDKFWEKDRTAKVNVTVDSGNNELDKLELVSLITTEASNNNAEIFESIIINWEELKDGSSNNIKKLDKLDKEITWLKSFDIELRLADNQEKAMSIKSLLLKYNDEVNGFDTINLSSEDLGAYSKK